MQNGTPSYAILRHKSGEPLSSGRAKVGTIKPNKYNLQFLPQSIINLPTNSRITFFQCSNEPSKEKRANLRHIPVVG